MSKGNIMMSEAKLHQARSLIKQKEYQQARAILLTMPDDPTARRWLRKLDEIAPAVEQEANHTVILQRASRLLTKQEWYEARELLEPIKDNPTAARWLARLDEIAPEPEFSGAIGSKPTDKQSQMTRVSVSPKLLIVVGGVMVTLVIGIVIIALLASSGSIGNPSSDVGDDMAFERVEEYCIAYSITDPPIRGFNPTGYCDEWATIVSNDERARACHEQSPVLGAPFVQCLAAEGFVPDPDYIQSYEFLLVVTYGACARHSGEEFDPGTFAMPFQDIHAYSDGCGSWAWTMAFENEAAICAQEIYTDDVALDYAWGYTDVFDTTDFEDCLRQHGTALPDVMR